MKKKNGFTMVEMLGVVILLAAIMLLAFPAMLEQFRKSKEDINEATLQLIYSGADEYFNQYLEVYPKIDGNSYCVFLQDIVDAGYLSDSITDVLNDKDFDFENDNVKAVYQNNKYNYSLQRGGKCVRKFYEVMSITDEVKALDPNKNLRYVGPNPNNYVRFNNELWRIIGVFDGQAKIIRNEYYSTAIVWDDDSDGSRTNNWATSLLQTELNETYLSNIQVNDSTSYGYIDLEHVWNIGAYNGYYITSATRSIFYNAERSETTAAAYGSLSTWTGAIGLMYMSDYGYATNGDTTLCDGTVMYYWGTGNYKTECVEKSWLYDSSYTQWTITPYSDQSIYVYDLNTDGYVDYYKVVSNNFAVRPTLFLKSSVGIASGTGKIGDPFILSQ